MHAKDKSGPGLEMEKYDILFTTKYTKPLAHIHAISDSHYNVTHGTRGRQHPSYRVLMLKLVIIIISQNEKHDEFDSQVALL